MTALWTAAEAVRATGGRSTGGAWQVDGVSIDTRDLAPGDLFVALHGENRDGHAFVADALRKGAGAVLIDDPAGVAADAPALLVADTQAGLEALGQDRRATVLAKVVGITGSAGKTTSRAALATLLQPFGTVHASAKSYNNHWGVPLSLARMPLSTGFAVLELGMNNPGELDALAAQVRPDVALLTTIAAAHLGNFPDEAAIARAKAEIFAHVGAGGTIVLPADNPWHGLLREVAAERSPARVIGFGRSAEADVRIVAEAGDAVSSRLTCTADGCRIDYRLPLAGAHQALNSAGWLAVVMALGLDLEMAAARMAEIRPVEGRGERRRLRLADGRTVLLLDESYNANPASVRAALDVLGRQPGRRIAVLGDMRELGPRADQLHVGLAEELRRAGVAAAYLCGEHMAELANAVADELAVVHAPTSAALLAPVLAGLEDGDVVLVKGSLGSRMRVIVDGLLAAEAATVVERG